MKIIKKVHREIRKVGKYYENKKIKAKWAVCYGFSHEFLLN